MPSDDRPDRPSGLQLEGSAIVSGEGERFRERIGQVNNTAFLSHKRI
jgi:hypothetical protein